MRNCSHVKSRDFPESNCLAVLRRHGKSFYFAGKFLNTAQLHDCARLYAFCRYLDDLVDGSTSSLIAAAKIEAISTEVASGQSSQPIVNDFLGLAHLYRFDHNIVLELIQGLRSDIDQVAFQDWDRLMRYCYQVAGTVGLLMAKILGSKSSYANFHAIDLGIAMQLTNISRDVMEDALSGRQYVPNCILPSLSPAEISSPDLSAREKLAAAVDLILSKADCYYRSGEIGLSYLPIRSHLAILISSRIYRAIGTELRRRGCATWHGRVFVSSQRKVLISLRTLVTFFRQRALSHSKPAHDANLHRALVGLPQTHTGKDLK